MIYSVKLKVKTKNNSPNYSRHKQINIKLANSISNYLNILLNCYALNQRIYPLRLQHLQLVDGYHRVSTFTMETF